MALPPGLISSQSEITIETWVIWPFPPDAGVFWARIFDFGTNIVEPGYGNWGTSYFFLTPATDPYSFPPYKAVLRAAITTNQNFNTKPEIGLDQSSPQQRGVTCGRYLQSRAGNCQAYLNGVPVSSGVAVVQLADIVDVNNWLGRSQFTPPDPQNLGTYDEFRIYDGFLQDSDIAADYAAGPNVIGTDYLLHSFVSTTNLMLSWGPAMASWILQSSLTVDSNALWTPVSTTTNFQNNRYSVSLPMSDNSAFFRLQQGP